MTRLIFLMEKPSDGFDGKLRERLSAEGCGFWHWFEGSWVVADPMDRNVGQWRDILQSLSQTTMRLVVLDADRHGWAAYGQQQWFPWFDEYWSRTKK